MSDIFQRLMSATAWKMTPPAPYGAFHLLFFIIGFAVCVFAAWKLRKLGERGNRRLLFSTGLFLAVCEVYKQLFYFYYIGEGHYQWWIFPFQLCSIPMYLCLIIPFLKEGKLKSGMCDFLLMYNLLGGFIAFFEPSGLIHGYWTLTLHAFVWHMVLIFVGLYLGFSGRAGVRKENFFRATGFFVILCAVAFAVNLVFRRVSGGDINMFFIGPNVSPIIVFSSIGKRFGWYVSTILYIPCVCLGAFVISLPFKVLQRRLRRAPGQIKTGGITRRKASPARKN